MKLLIVIPTLGNGGAERVASILGNAFSKKHDVRIVLLEDSSINPYVLNDSIQIKKLDFKVKHGHKLSSIFLYFANFSKIRSALIKEIEEYNPSTIISFLPKVDFLISTIKLKGIRWIASERNDPKSRSFIVRKALISIFKKSSILVVQTNKVLNFYKKNKIPNVLIIKNPISRIIHQSTVANIINVPFILSVGRLDKQKNLGTLIKVYYHLKKRDGIEHKLIIIGEGPLRKKLTSLVSRLGIKDYVFLPGRIDDVASYYSKASLFVLPSKYEGMPNALLEAMSFGIPVVSTDFYTGAAKELICDGNGFLVPVDDKKALENAISRGLALNDDERRNMARRSFLVLEDYSVEKVIQEWEKILV